MDTREPTVDGGASVVARRPAKRGGNPRHRTPVVRLPWGYRTLMAGKDIWDEGLGEALVEAYYQSGGSLLQACRATGTSYPAAIRWRDTHPPFRAALQTCDQLIRDLVHDQFMARVLNGDERNPAWTMAYFKKHYPEYVDRKAAPTVALVVVDSTIRPLAAPPPALIETTATPGD